MVSQRQSIFLVHSLPSKSAIRVILVYIQWKKLTEVREKHNNEEARHLEGSF